MIAARFTHAFMRLALALTGVFVGLLGVIHLQPYDDSDVRAFVTPPSDCAAPCFMGIRPGVTTVDEAMDILWAHPWVDQVREFMSARGVRTIYWTWSGQQPALINPARRGFFFASRNLVRDVRVHTLVPLHTMMLIYGASDHGYVFGGLIGTPQSRFYQLIFDSSHVNIRFDLVRPDWSVCTPDLWTAPAELSFVARSPTSDAAAYYDPCLRTTLQASL